MRRRQGDQESDTARLHPSVWIRTTLTFQQQWTTLADGILTGRGSRQEHGSDIQSSQSRRHHQHRRLHVSLYLHPSLPPSLSPHRHLTNTPPAGTGSQPTGVSCKSISTQISEFLAAIDAKNIPVNHLWLDIEPENANDPGVECNAWQLGSAGNSALAKQWVAAIKATGRKWGIYANR